MASASAQDVRLSANVRAGGIDTSQRDQAGSRIRRARAVGFVQAPVDKVVQIVSDYGRYRHFMPNFLISRVLSRRGPQAVIYIQVSALQGLTTLWAEMRMRMLPGSEPTRVIAAHMTKGNLKQFDAEWQVTPIDAARSLVSFELCADPDFPLPFADGLVSDYNEKEAHRTVLGLRSYVAHGGSSAAP